MCRILSGRKSIQRSSVSRIRVKSSENAADCCSAVMCRSLICNSRTMISFRMVALSERNSSRVISPIAHIWRRRSRLFCSFSSCASFELRAFIYQAVEKPGCALSADRVSFAYPAINDEKWEVFALLPFPFCQLFEVHGSKFKLHPIRHLGQASIACITHGVFFFGICKDPFNGLFAPSVQFPVFRRVAGILCQFLVVLPDMALHCFHTIHGVGAKQPCGTICADVGITFIFPVALWVCSPIPQHLELRTDD